MNLLKEMELNFMNNLLLFFALPVATIILSIVLQRIIRSPILVALSFFSVFLVVAFSAFDETFLVYVIVYTIISFLSALLYRAITQYLSNQNQDDGTIDNDDENCGCCNRSHTLGNAQNCGERAYRKYWR